MWGYTHTLTHNTCTHVPTDHHTIIAAHPHHIPVSVHTPHMCTHMYVHSNICTQVHTFIHVFSGMHTCPQSHRCTHVCTPSQQPRPVQGNNVFCRFPGHFKLPNFLAKEETASQTTGCRVLAAQPPGFFKGKREGGRKPAGPGGAQLQGIKARSCSIKPKASFSKRNECSCDK